MILGKVKKRLEEDYDEYFSVNEIDIENDLVEAPRKVSCSNQCSATSSETRIDQHMSQEGLRTSRSVLTVAKYQESRNRVWQSTLNSTEHEEPKSRSIKAGRTRTSSSRYSNLDLVRSQSSYYQSMRDDECTPSSSVEYCTASSISLTKFQSIIDNSFDASLDQAFLSNDMTFEENAISQNGGEFLDETVVNCFTVCCCPRNSTPNFSKSSRRVTESLDSGILTDCSRDCFRASEEYLKEKRKDLGKRRCGERKMDLLPTYDFNTDSSYSDDSLNRRVDVAVRKFTENLILTERKVKIKLRRLQNLPRHRQERKRWKTGRQVKKLSESSSKYSSTYQFDFPQWQTDDDRFLSSSTPPVFSFSDSEIDHL
ncbi:uncharacterized protein LOC143186268 [Calliopsis andreniformis]|uniref:uncharacterized protein LOC143186268 n=1 Tax=Calliopsis andreniformis TaxID=337506 RepID=UPI003FCE5D55